MRGDVHGVRWATTRRQDHHSPTSPSRWRARQRWLSSARSGAGKTHHGQPADALSLAEISGCGCTILIDGIDTQVQNRVLERGTPVTDGKRKRHVGKGSVEMKRGNISIRRRTSLTRLQSGNTRPAACALHHAALRRTATLTLPNDKRCFSFVKASGLMTPAKVRCGGRADFWMTRPPSVDICTGDGPQGDEATVGRTSAAVDRVRITVIVRPSST